MNSLVGYGVSSESDSDREVSDENTPITSAQEVCCELPIKKSRNFLLESGSSSSDSEPEEEQPPAQVHFYSPQASLPSPVLDVLPNPGFSPNLNKLPPPPLQACSDSSVFANPFKAQADQKLCALQKHVPLTVQARPSHIGGRLVCVSYRKDGRCRFGIKCKFAHDSDLQTLVASTDCHPKVSEGALASAGSVPHAGGRSAEEESHSFRNDTEEEKPEGKQAKKRRVGLSNTLIPPKRAMKQYAVQRSKEVNKVP